MIESIDHIGIAVRSLDESIPFYRDILKLGEPAVEYVPEQKVRVAVFPVGDDPGAGRIELLEGVGPESPISRYIEKRGTGIHHVALRSGDLQTDIAAISCAGLPMIDEVPRTGAGGAEIAFVHPSAAAGVLIELCSPAAGVK